MWSRKQEARTWGPFSYHFWCAPKSFGREKWDSKVWVFFKACFMEKKKKKKKTLPWWLRWQSICLQCRRPGFNPWIGKIPCRRKWKPTPVILPGKFHGRRSLVGYSPWDLKESDMTKQLHFMKKKGKWFQFLLHLSFSTGNPLGLLVFGGSHFCLGEKQWCFGFWFFIIQPPMHFSSQEKHDLKLTLGLVCHFSIFANALLNLT